MHCRNSEFPEEPICSTCERKIEFYPYRHVTLEGQNNVNQVVFFHFFFPCYDFSYMSRRYRAKMIDVGFTFDSDDIPSEESTRNFIRNSDLWISSQHH